MADIFDLVDARIQGDVIQTLQGVDDPYIGAELFPARKQMSLDLKFIKGYKSLPMALKPSTLGSRAFTRDRIGGATVTNEIPFFREQMPIDERLRRRLAVAQEDAQDPYTRDVLKEIFNDTKALVDGANVVAEAMRMKLLFNGAFTMKGADKDGALPAYEFNYDPSGKWASTNIITLTGTRKWSNVDSTPVSDLIEIIDKAADLGVTLTRGILGVKTFKDITATKEFKDMFRNPDNSLRAFSRAEALTQLSTKVGLTLVINTRAYKDVDGKEQKFVPENALALFPVGRLGNTVYATTPEELDLQQGYGNASVSVVNTGVTITTAKEYGPPVNVKTVVSEFVLPSFENMASVFVVKY